MKREARGGGSRRAGAGLPGVLLAALLLAALLLLAGCGDGEPASFGQGYDAATDRYADAIEPILEGQIAMLLDPAGMEEAYGDLAAATNDLFDDVAALEPPPELAEAHEAMLLNLVAQSRALEDAAEAERAGDEAAAMAAIEEFAELQQAWRALDDELTGAVAGPEPGD